MWTKHCWLSDAKVKSYYKSINSVFFVIHENFSLSLWDREEILIGCPSCIVDIDYQTCHIMSFFSPFRYVCERSLKGESPGKFTVSSTWIWRITSEPGAPWNVKYSGRQAAAATSTGSETHITGVTILPSFTYWVLGARIRGNYSKACSLFVCGAGRWRRWRLAVGIA